MGCLHSKKETLDHHPNVFRVVNIDENGIDLCSGQLEITDSDIILYREGRDSTVWPLHSLRRYGFEGDIFSFESGRRCETGEGIYAFRCRRASLLFRTLQQQIQLRNIVQDSVQYPVSRLSPSPPNRQILQTSVLHQSSIDNGLPNNDHPNSAIQVINQAVALNPSSASSADILEVMPLYPRPQTNSVHVTNVYHLREFKREHNNNHSETTSDLRHVYSNDLSRDLAILRNTLRQEAAFNTMKEIEEETRFLEGRYINEDAACVSGDPKSPTFSTSSEHYAQLSIEQKQQETSRLYMNIVPSDITALVSDLHKNEVPPATPTTPKQVEYCNLNMGVRPEVNSYANLSLGDIADSVKNAKQKMNFSITEHSQKFSESDTFTSMSPVEELEVNYAVLDIDANKEAARVPRDLASPDSSKNESTASCSSHGRSRLVSQTSLENTPATNLGVAPCANVGYTTIDFDKTVALTSVAAGTDIDKEGPRKTRHNGTCASP